MNCQRAMIFFMDPVVARRFNKDVPGVTQTVQVDKGRRASCRMGGGGVTFVAELGGSQHQPCVQNAS